MVSLRVEVSDSAGDLGVLSPPLEESLPRPNLEQNWCHCVLTLSRIAIKEPTSRVDCSGNRQKRRNYEEKVYEDQNFCEERRLLKTSRRNIRPVGRPRALNSVYWGFSEFF